MGSSTVGGTGLGTPPLLIPRTRHVLQAQDVDGFFKIAEEALTLEINRQGEVPDGAHPVYVRNFPKERLAKTDQPFDVITYRVVSSAMAPMSNAGDRIPRKPTLIPVGLDPRATGYVLINQVWWELATVEFTIWSKSSDTRSALVTWFHKLLMRYANPLKFFEGRGVEQFQFVGRGEDQFDDRENQEIYFGTLTYQFRVQYLDTFSQRRTDTLTVNAQIDQNDQLTFSLPATAAQ